MIKVVLDTSVVVSGLRTRLGAGNAVLRLVAERRLVGLVSSARLSFPVPVASLARRDLPDALPAGPALGQDTATLAAEVGVRASG